MKIIKFFDCFAGIGGFRSGLERAGGFECVGFCEIDKFAAKAYNAMFDNTGVDYFEDIRAVDAAQIADFDLFVGGFPCQPFSCSGEQRGFDDPRGTLIYQVARILEAKRPRAFLLENVAGLLQNDSHRSFAEILRLLSELGYCVEWRLCDSAAFGVPQSRQRVYIAGYLDTRCAGKILSFKCFAGKSPYQLIGGQQAQRVYSVRGTAITQCASAGGWGGKIGLYFIDLNDDGQITDYARCLLARYDCGLSRFRGSNSGIFVEGYDETVGEKKFFAFEDENGEIHVGRIRKLMPRESWRLQGFTDEQFDKVETLGISDGQLWKMAGNAVSVPVIEFIGKRIREIIFEGRDIDETDECE